jgi:hypothetical protein
MPDAWGGAHRLAARRAALALAPGLAVRGAVGAALALAPGLAVRGAVLALLAGLAGLAAPAPPARAEVVWLCKPGVEPDPCRESLRTTIESPDGGSHVEAPPLPADPPIDCFYVYPTVSEQPATNADKSKDEQQVAIARYQAQRYSQRCRVYAPMYRQLTLASIFTGTAEQRAAGRRIAYADVREAWLEYLARENRGRGVVLIGHSQGASMLRQLIRGEIDGRPEVRRRIVSALLLGGNVLVRKGGRDGGDFRNLPACTASDQVGCVIAFSIFGDPPPDNTRFGRAPDTDTTGAGLPAGPEYEVLCTNPSSLGTNERRPLTSLVYTEPFPGTIGAALILMYGGPQPSAPTPWLQPADRYSGRCERSNGANVLMAEPIGRARKLNPSPTPDWGLHLADANLALGELVDIVGRQAAAYLRSSATHGRPRLRVSMRCASRRRLRVALGGADRRLVRRMDILVGRRRLARDSRPPFARTIRRVRRVTVGVTLRDGRRARLSRHAPRCR